VIGILARPASIFRLGMLCAVLQPLLFAQSSSVPRHLTLDEAVDLALHNNHVLRMATDKVEELRDAKRVAASDYFPKLTNSSAFEHATQHNVVRFAEGSFGALPIIGPLPRNELIVNQDNLDHIFSRTQLAQPLTQLFRIHDANRVAQADVRASRAELKDQQLQIALVVRQLYYGLLIAAAESKAAAAVTAASQREITEAESDIAKGSALEVALIQAKASVLQNQQQELQARIQHDDLQAEFNNALGLPVDAAVELDDSPGKFQPPPSREECMRLAESAQPTILAAAEAVSKARAAVAAARSAYIPDISAFARHDYQDGLAFLFHNYDTIGVSFNYELFEGGKRHGVVKERLMQLAQAEENLRRLKDEAAVTVQKALDKLEQSRHLVEVAKQVVALRAEGNRLSVVQVSYGTVLESKRLGATAALLQAQVDLLKAELSYSLSRAEVDVAIGTLPR
jgi:outer membrane protein TolC